MTDPLDDALRDALRAEAAGVEAGPELLDRARAGAPAARRRNPLLLAAAASLVIAGIAAGLVLAARGSDESLDVLGNPDGSSTSTTVGGQVPVVCTTTAEGLPPCGDATEHPRLLVFLREDGWLVTMDLVTGAQQQLLTKGDPRDPTPLEEGGGISIDRIDLSPDGRWIYFSTCCEPAVGQTFRVPVTGGEPELVGFGFDPRVSPDGRFVATSGGDRIWIHPTDPPEPEAEGGGTEVAGSAHGFAWSPDGTRLAYVDGMQGEPGTMRTLRWDGNALVPDPIGSAQSGASFAGWTPDGMPLSSSGEPIADDRVLTQDATYRWQLRVDEAGEVTYFRDGYQSGAELPINGLPPLLLADW